MVIMSSSIAWAVSEAPAPLPISVISLTSDFISTAFNVPFTEAKMLLLGTLTSLTAALKW